jgi:hypothetical protein
MLQMPVSAARKAKLIREMIKSREIHARGHYIVSERVLIESIVTIIENQRVVEVPVEFDPVIDEATDALINMQG